MSELPIPAPVWQLVRQYLASSTPPCDFAAHYDTYAPQALVLVGDTPFPVMTLDRDVYVSRREADTGGTEPAHGGFDLGEALAWIEDETGGSLAVTVVPRASGVALQAAFRLSGPDWQIVGACLHEGPLPSAAVLITRCIAEFTHWTVALPGERRPVSGLDLSYRRLFDLSQAILLSLPEARFTCQSRGFCCGAFRVDPTPNALAIGTAPWRELGVKPPAFTYVPDDKGPALILDNFAHGGCAAHSDNGCDVHATIGWQPIPVCQTFPYRFVVTPDGICVTTSFTCHTVGENQGLPLAEQERELRHRLQPLRQKLDTMPATVQCTPGGASMAWPTYRLLEDRLLATLADRGIGTLHVRIRRGSSLVSRLTAMPAGVTIGPADVDEAWERAVDGQPAGSTEAADDLMLRVMAGRADPEWRNCPFDGWQLDAWHTGRGSSLAAALDDELITRYVRTVLFRKTGLARVGAAFVWATVVWVARAWERETLHRHQAEGLPLSRDLQLETARRLDMALMHQPLLNDLGTDPALLPFFLNPLTWQSLGV